MYKNMNSSAIVRRETQPCSSRGEEQESVTRATVHLYPRQTETAAGFTGGAPAASCTCFVYSDQKAIGTLFTLTRRVGDIAFALQRFLARHRPTPDIATQGGRDHLATSSSASACRISSA